MKDVVTFHNKLASGWDNCDAGSSFQHREKVLAKLLARGIRPVAAPRYSSQFRMPHLPLRRAQSSLFVMSGVLGHSWRPAYLRHSHEVTVRAGFETALRGVRLMPDAREYLGGPSGRHLTVMVLPGLAPDVPRASATRDAHPAGCVGEVAAEQDAELKQGHHL